jgi:CHAD domain-containing protein
LARLDTESFVKRYASKSKALMELAAPGRGRPSPEAIHDIRVATRRVQAMVRLLPRALRATAPFREHDRRLKKLLASTSRIRDVDTILKTLTPQRASLPAGTLEGLAKERRSLEDAAKVAIREAGAREAPAVDPAALSGAQLARRLQKKARKHLNAMDGLLAEVQSDETAVVELHALRMEVKKLRYLMEVAHPKRSYLNALQSLQNDFGAIHDIDVAVALLRDMGVEADVRGAVQALGRERHRAYLRLGSQLRDSRPPGPRKFRNLAGLAS